MRKLIAIVICFIFIFEGTGYCLSCTRAKRVILGLPCTLVVCDLRVPLSFGKQKEGRIEIIHPERLESLDIYAIVLDWDGTISTDLWFWENIERDVISEQLGFTREEAMHIVQEETNGLYTADRMRYAVEKAKEKGVSVSKSAEELTEEAHRKTVERLEQEKSTRWKEESPIIPGIDKLLKALTERDIICYVATSYIGEDKRKLAEELDLKEYFRGGIYGTGDPGYTNKKKFLESRGLKPQQLALVGDTVGDIRAAKETGCLAIGFAKDALTREALVKAGADIIINENYNNLEGILSVLKLQEIQNFGITVRDLKRSQSNL